MINSVKTGFASCAIAALLAFAPSALALPSSGSTEPAAAAPAPTTPKKIKCKRNETAKLMTTEGKKVWQCKKLKANLLTNNELYQQARALADQGEYEWALSHLALATNANDPAILTLTGYAHRKAGRLETGMAFYDKALAQNPDLAETREYLGEAFIQAGFRDKAEGQLKIIQSICGTDCEAYKALHTALEANP